MTVARPTQKKFESTYNRLMSKMLREGQKIPNVRQNVGTLAGLQRDLTQSINTLAGSAPLLSTVGNIEAGLNILGNSKATLALQDAFTPQFTTLKVESIDRAKRHDELAAKVKAEVEAFEKATPDIIAAIEKKDFAKVDNILNKFSSIMDNLKKEINQLTLSEKNVQIKLDDLNKKVFENVPSEERSKLKAPEEVPSYEAPSSHR